MTGFSSVGPGRPSPDSIAISGSGGGGKAASSKETAEEVMAGPFNGAAAELELSEQGQRLAAAEGADGAAVFRANLNASDDGYYGKTF